MAVNNKPKYSPMSSSANESYELSNDFTIVTNNIKDLLKSRIFLGRYLERLYVNKTGKYRDVVLVSAAETELKADLLEAKRLILSVNPEQWVGITENDNLGFTTTGVCIWTGIKYQPFGAFWFQIKNVSFRDQELIIKVNCIRHINEAFLELEPLLTRGVKAEGDLKTNIIPAINIDQNTLKDLVITLKSVVTIQNIKDVITFFFALVMVIFTGGVEFIYFLGNFILALFRESSIFVTNATPFLLGVLDFFSKIVGGFYILLAMIFRQTTPTPPPAPIRNNRKITYFPNNDLYGKPDFCANRHSRNFD